MQGRRTSDGAKSSAHANQHTSTPSAHKDTNIRLDIGGREIDDGDPMSPRGGVPTPPPPPPPSLRKNGRRQGKARPDGGPVFRPDRASARPTGKRLSWSLGPRRSTIRCKTPPKPTQVGCGLQWIANEQRPLFKGMAEPLPPHDQQLTTTLDHTNRGQTHSGQAGRASAGRREGWGGGVPCTR